MTDHEGFEKWLLNKNYPKSDLIFLHNGQKYQASHISDMFQAWQARGELDAVKIKELEDEIIGWQEKSIEREQHLQIANSAVEELTAKLDKAKEVLNMANWNQIGGYEGQQKWLELNRELDK